MVGPVANPTTPADRHGEESLAPAADRSHETDGWVDAAGWSTYGTRIAVV